MLLIPPDSETIVEIDRLDWNELNHLLPLSDTVLCDMPSNTLHCFASTEAMEENFKSSENYAIRTIKEKAVQAVGFIAVRGLHDVKDMAPVVETYILDEQSQHLLPVSLVGICKYLLELEGVFSVEAEIGSNSYQSEALKTAGFTHFHTIGIAVDRGPKRQETYDLLWQLQDPSLLNGNEGNFSQLCEGWKRYKQLVEAVTFTEFRPGVTN